MRVTMCKLRSPTSSIIVRQRAVADTSSERALYVIRPIVSLSDLLTSDISSRSLRRCLDAFKVCTSTRLISFHRSPCLSSFSSVDL